MNIAAILFVLFLVGALVYFLVYRSKGSSDKVVILSGSQPGNAKGGFYGSLPLSFNNPEGIVFSYTGWVLVKDFNMGYGKKRVIFKKGDDGPGLYLDSTSNSLMVAIKTYGATETILIPNIPAMKWIHFAIVVDQTSVNIYINGTLRQHHTLGQLPDQNNDELTMGSEWDGVLGNLVYYSRNLSYDEIRKLSGETPPNDLQPKISGPGYFDITWYIGRLNSA
jgi:hypothetical protein